MKETTFELFARARADQVITSILAEDVRNPMLEDDPRFESYYSDVTDLDPSLPVSPSAIFYEACEDKCNELLTDAENILSGYRVSDCANLEKRLNVVSTRLKKMHRCVDNGCVVGFAPWVNCVFEANRLHEATQRVAEAEAIMQDSATFFPQVPAYLLP